MRQISAISILMSAALVAVLAEPAASATTYCPRVLHRATRLIIVTVPTMDGTKATMRTFVRKSPASSWKPEGTPESAVVGANGIGWGGPFIHLARRGEPIKQEGDKRTPAGLYRLGATFGFDKSDRPGHLQLKPEAHFCVHDTRSAHYGRIMERSKAGEKTEGENMASVPLYRRGIVIEYPPLRRSKAGSCVFLHVWGGDGVGTAGCVGLPEERVKHLQEWIEGRHAVIGVVMEDAVSRFGDCLPLETGVSRQEPPAALPLPHPRRAGQRADLTR